MTLRESNLNFSILHDWWFDFRQAQINKMNECVNKCTLGRAVFYSYCADVRTNVVMQSEGREATDGSAVDVNGNQLTFFFM